MFPSDLYLITDRLACEGRDLLEVTEEALVSGVKLLQYREKNLSFKSQITMAHQIKKLCERFDGTFIVNDDVNLALAVGANGLHIGQEDISLENARALLGTDAIIGVTVRNEKQAKAAEISGANYVGLGPIFKSPTKQPMEPLGCNIIGLVRKHVKIPIYAIGGISLEKVKEVIMSGADGIALISGILNSPNVGERINQFLEQIRIARQTQSH